MSEYIKAGELINGKTAKVIVNIDGNIRVAAELIDITARIEKNKAEVPVMGYLGVQHKATGWSGTVSGTYYYVSSEWSKMMIEYAKTGIDKYFEVIIENLDNNSKIGAQTVHLYDVNLNGVDIAKADIKAEFLDASFEATFSGVDLLDEFGSAL